MGVEKEHRAAEGTPRRRGQARPLRRGTAAVKGRVAWGGGAEERLPGL